MKRKFTFLTAALALLAFLAPATVGWGQTTYTKVTTAPADWSGTYVIIADDSEKIFTGQSGSNNYGGHADVTISSESVTGNYSDYEVLVEKSGTSYTMKHVSSGKYLGWNTGNNLHFSTDEPSTDAFKWNLSTSSILNANDNTRKLQYNSGSPRFACYTSSQKVAYLYLKESVSPTTDPTITVADATATVPVGGDAGTMAITCANLEISGVSDFAIQFYDDEDNELNENNVPSWIEASVESQGEGYQVSYTVEANEGPARTAYFKVFAEGDPDFVYSNLVTISQDAYEIPVASANYTLATTIESGGTYIIVGLKPGEAYAMGVQNNNNRKAELITISENTVTVTSAVHEFVINEISTGFYSIADTDEPGYLFAASNSANWLKTQNELDDNSKWEISIDNEDGVASIVASQSSNRNVMRFNSSSTLFSCYALINNQADIYLYKKVDQSADECTLVVPGYSGEGGYRLIASPITVDPSTVDGLTSGTYDLYRFDQSKDLEWRNYKSTPFYLIPGKGYLYAKAGNNDFSFTLTGVAYDGDGQVPLSYTEGANWAGWNLIGNPFDTEATIPSTYSYYTMNEDGSELIPGPGESITIGAMEGLFVLATEEGQSVIFTAGAKANTEHNARLVLNLNSNSKLIDRAIVRFGEGQTLPKFMLNEAHTKLYFTQNGTDYAVVRSEGEGEMPINFKAEHNGTYTIGISAKDMEFSRLRLIDNMTGADIDLLATPSYTFEAKTTDYASRFRLVFSSTGIEENENANFAYYNGSEWVINATDNATVEVIDMMGRVIRVCTGGVHTLSTNGMASGVYMMRLIDGNNVKTQKIVVR